jgi:hypothetical protein
VRRWRKPLIVMTPKSLLRHPRAVSTLDECAAGLHDVIADEAARTASARVLLCSGRSLRPREARGDGRDDVVCPRRGLYPTRVRRSHGPRLVRDGTPDLGPGAREHGRLAPCASPSARRRGGCPSPSSAAPPREPRHGFGQQHRLERRNLQARVRRVSRRAGSDVGVEPGVVGDLGARWQPDHSRSPRGPVETRTRRGGPRRSPSWIEMPSAWKIGTSGRRGRRARSGEGAEEGAAGGTAVGHERPTRAERNPG